MAFVQTTPPLGTETLADSAWRLDVGAAGTLPSPGLQLLPDAGAAVLWTVAPAGAGQRLSVVGALTRGRPLAVAGGSSTVAVQLRPGIAHRLFRTPAASLRDREIPLEALWPAETRSLRRRPGRDASSGERLAALAARLVERAGDVRLEGRLSDLLAALADEGGDRVTEWAARAGRAPRTLRRLFERELGISPAAFRRIERFGRLVSAAWDSDAGSWADRAAAAGYYDQAHMNREVRALAGVTPARLLSPCAALLSA